jgi:hypothetical protein
MNTQQHAELEFEIAGYNDGEEMNAMMKNNVMTLLEVFSAQGHSGLSAPHCVSLFSKLAKHEPLGPLTGAEAEWGEEFNDEGTRQNRRASHVFLEKGGQAYDINAVVFEDADGSRWNNSKGHRYVTFPYTPTTKVVKRQKFLRMWNWIKGVFRG